MIDIADLLSDPIAALDRMPWAAEMAACPQDVLYHAEGDVLTHTRMVMAELLADLAPEDPARDRLILAVAMHDIAKPETTVIEWCDKEQRERVRQPGHALKGAITACQALIDAGAESGLARDVFGLIAWHQRPMHMLDKDPERMIVRFTAETGLPWSDLLRLCRADNRGRVSPNIEDGLATLDLLEEEIDKLGARRGRDLLREGDWGFASATDRMRFLQGRSTAWDETWPAVKGRMYLLSGLPGSGKNTLIAREFPDLPMVSFDDLRVEAGIDHDDNQGRVIQAAFEAARVNLRKGQDFVWNATSLSRQSREKICGLAADYGFEVVAISIDIPLNMALRQNAARAEPVPEEAIRRMARRREPILPDEAQKIGVVQPHLAEIGLHHVRECAARGRPDAEDELPVFSSC